MPTQTQNQDVNAISALLQQMLEGWNKGSGETFAAPFTEDADFVAFDGTYTKGRADIAESHQVLFDHFLRGTRLVRESSKRAPPEPGNRPDACRRRHGDGRNRPLRRDTTPSRRWSSPNRTSSGASRRFRTRGRSTWANPRKPELSPKSFGNCYRTALSH